MRATRVHDARVTVGLLLAVAAAWALWMGSSDMATRWSNLPPAPAPPAARLSSLGDTQFAYRSGALTLQTLGDTGGNVVPLKEYNYARLGQWFGVLYGLDPASDHVPMIAAFYFGAGRVPDDLAVIVNYLAQVGSSPVGEKWRWLAQAAYLARHRMGDMPRALDLAYMLSRMKLQNDTMPIWARQMPAFILNEQGEKQASRAMIEDMLMSGRQIHPNEVNFLKDYLQGQLDVPAAEVEEIMNMRGEGATERTP